jgi:hypothetical protein
MERHNEILHSNEAELILNSQTFKSAIEILKAEYINLWTNTQADEKDLREQLHKSVKLLPEIERHLRIIVETGKITKSNLNRLRKVI